ncbi:interleukin-15 receptor subunit alpha isoform 3-T3 [Polymixia lowei]
MESNGCFAEAFLSKDPTRDACLYLSCSCPCPPPSVRKLTEPPDVTMTTNCCRSKSQFRYKCIDGYVRKAGTSNLTRCKQTGAGKHWSNLTLICIPDPRRPPTKQPKTSTTSTTSKTTDPKRPPTEQPKTSTTSTTSKTIVSAVASTTVMSTEQQAPTDILQEPVINPTITPSTEQTAGSPSSSAFQPTETDKTQSTPSLTLPVQAQVTDRTTSRPANGGVTSRPAGSPTSSSRNQTSDRHHGTAIASGLSVVGLLVIICASAGIGFFCLKRRQRNTGLQPTEEERVPMNPVSDAPPRPSDLPRALSLPWQAAAR